MLRRAVVWMSLAVVYAAAAEGRERRYLEVTAPAFVLTSAVGETRTREIAVRMANFRSGLELALDVDLPTTLPTRIYALSHRDWRRYAQPREGMGGYFLSQPFSSDLVFDADDEGSSAHELMFHEYTHYILRTQWEGEVPAFFDEGLAEVFSTARVEKDAIWLTPREDYVSVLKRQQWLPFERLLEIRRQDAEYKNHSLAPAFYAQAWATMHYVMAVDPAVGKRVRDYISEVNAGGSRIAAAERLIGESAARANQRIADFLLAGKRPPVILLQTPNIDPVAIGKVRALGHHDSTLTLGELLTRKGKPDRKTLQLFEDIRRRTPDSARARVGTGWALLKSGQQTEAAAMFDSVPTDALDDRTSLMLALGLFQLIAASGPAESGWSGTQRKHLAHARTLFQSALDDPQLHLEAANGYVLASIALGAQDDALIALAQRAYGLAPKNPDLAVTLALLHESVGKKDLARPYWEQASRYAPAGPLRARILSALEANSSGSAPPAH